VIPFLAPAVAGFVGLPRWLKLVLAGLVLIGLAFVLHKCAVRDAVEADRDASKAEALSDAREADEDAEAASDDKTQEIEDGNERARDAARGSSDPLGDGLRSLRADQDRNGKAAGRSD
jgi:hypothetical protein